MPHAEVAELADALGSGLSGLTVVRVQVPPSAQKTRLRASFFISESSFAAAFLTSPLPPHTDRFTAWSRSGSRYSVMAQTGTLSMLFRWGDSPYGRGIASLIPFPLFLSHQIEHNTLAISLTWI
jgi:hypothetical protein